MYSSSSYTNIRASCIQSSFRYVDHMFTNKEINCVLFENYRSYKNTRY